MTTASPEISVIMATLNAEATIRQSLASILYQRDVTVEVIVCDGASTDATLSIVKALDDERIRVDSRPDGGIYEAWNRGLEHARGRYLSFLGADDRLTRDDALSLLISETSEEPDLVTCLSRLAAAEPRQNSQIRGGAWDWACMQRGMCIENRSALHHRSLLERLGPFDPSFRVSGDYEFLLRAGPSLAARHLDEVLVDIGPGGISERLNILRIREAARAQWRHRVASPPAIVANAAYELRMLGWHQLKSSVKRVLPRRIRA